MNRMKKTLSLNIFLALSLLAVLTVNAQDVRMYAFAHSLIDHASEHEGTNIMYWINDISIEAGNSFATGGQFGFLTNHDDLPPRSNLGYDGITGVWDDSSEPFSDADINTVLITAANFIHDVPPTDPHPLDNATTVVQSTEEIFDWVNTEEPDVNYYIYANWPEMNLASEYPPTLPLQSEIDDFHSLTIGTFADWWIDYQDAMLVSRPALNTRLIPVGMIISRILTDVVPNPIPFDSLYEDAAPHGRETVYFLAGMITYMAVHEGNIPDTYMPNATVHSEIRSNLETIRNFAWNELVSFNLEDGSSRVFHSSKVRVEDETINPGRLSLYPNPASRMLNINLPSTISQNIGVQMVNLLGQKFDVTLSQNGSDLLVDVSGLPNGIYFYKVISAGGNQQTGKVVILH